MFLGPPDTEGFQAQSPVLKKDTIKHKASILKNVKQYHAIVSLSGPESTGAYDEDDEIGSELDDDDDKVLATSAEARKIVHECEQQLAGSKRRRSELND